MNLPKSFYVFLCICFISCIGLSPRETSDSNQSKSSRLSVSQMQCLVKNMIHEAGNQSDKGKLAVAAVTLNRVNAVGFPSTICGVVYEKVGGMHQFSWTAFKKEPKIDPKVYAKTYDLAHQLVYNQIDSPIGPDVTYYHAAYMSSSNKNVRWFKRTLIKVATIGDHIFYRGRT